MASGVLGKALAGLGQGMAVVGQESLRDRAMMRREEALMKLRGAQEQEQYARNRADTLTDQETASKGAGEAALQKSRDEQTKLATEHLYDVELEGVKQSGAQKLEKIKGGDGKVGGWKPEELEKEARVLVAKGMGLDSDNIMNFDKNLQKEFYDSVARIVSEVRRNPSLSVGAAASRVIQGEDKPQVARPWPTGGKLDEDTARKLGVETKPESPPMAGARQAPDGKWYVQKDGKYYLVTP